MNDHPGRLVNDDDRGVFIKNGEGKGFRLERKRLGLGKNS
jgi:hypothetical protein